MSARRKGQRGAAAVEFALVVPVLLILVMGIIEFGRAYYVQTTLSSAAREGVRTMALQNSASAARTATENAATGVPVTDGQIGISYLPTTATTCSVTGTAAPPSVVVTVTYPLAYLTKFFGTSITLTAKGVMRCNG